MYERILDLMMEGIYLSDGSLYGIHGTAMQVEREVKNFIRWYSKNDKLNEGIPIEDCYVYWLNNIKIRYESR